ncbi:exodeoxyribonuclease V subunit alpha [Buchnera aphidicola]|uniref:RecBCD enzyme subunit RecD n=1 Tax=Buchnera aphidicola (Lipaphis pseudobrassicae) TaxID=1258543 RepID=A0A4D6Y0S3_9GAMM|nr:exodeoxyribonuclease V subunit alpha [Buchnera aphidicola]QCI22457.1 exodeoxyribonuclease V subunit alpha [Buchnera aphidicola (Lipaphis pseudobrassicae)]
MFMLLKKSLQKKLIRPIDFYFGKFISNNNPILMLIGTCISYENSNGHIFLPIEYFEKNYFLSIFNKKLVKNYLEIVEKKFKWKEELLKHPSVSNGSILTPLVLFKKKIYLYKMWKAENNIFQYLKKEHKINVNKKKCSKILDNLFPGNKKNFQKIAVALTLITNITFIIGAPGTGKTTTILKIIIALIKNEKKSIKIQLSAPTGKATTHLNEIITNNIFDLYLSEKEKKCLPYNAVTIHKLLGIEKVSQKSYFKHGNLLDLDVLIIDESSMIDILMMEKIFNSVSKNTKLIFIGDHNQLCPIETGFILKDICYYSNHGYNLKILNYIKALTKYQFLINNEKKTPNFISNKICTLKKSYRFNKSSGIYLLSNAIYKNKKPIIKKFFNNSIKNITFHEVNSIKQYRNMIKNIIVNYKNFWEKIRNKEKIQEIIKAFQNYQVLCILNNGLFGVYGLNQQLEDYMYKKNIIKYFYVNKTRWYIGKPIVININNKCLDLFNGAIGITNIDKKGVLQVSFLKKDDNIHNIPINILRNYETGWTTTVHKAQGSQFFNTTLILPNFDSRILNKDILYTGLTRSKEILSVFATKEIFMKTILKKTDKKNSLIDRIKEF